MRHTRYNGPREVKLKCSECGTKIESTLVEARPKWMFNGPQAGQLSECQHCEAILEYVETGIGSLQLRLAPERRTRQIRELDGAPPSLPRLSALVEAARSRRPVAVITGVSSLR